MIGSIAGTVNVVTGAGSGLGRATLKRLLDHGAVGVLAIDKNLDEIQTEYQDDKKDERIVFARHEAQNEEHTEKSLRNLFEKFGRLDNVINCAGVALAFMFYNRNNANIYSLDHINNLLSFNTHTPFNVNRLAINYMKLTTSEQTKCLINVSCTSCLYPAWGHTGYAASKAAIDSMTIATARELAPLGIRCNTIRPGYFDTKQLGSVPSNIKQYLATEVNELPNRLGHPEEFAHLVQTIIENQYLNGAIIRLDAAAMIDAFMPSSDSAKK